MVANCSRLFISAPVVRDSKNSRKSLWKYSEDLYSEQSGLCFWCSNLCTKIVLGEQKTAECMTAFTMDHVIPYSRGGRAEKTNLVGACKSCNSIRGLVEMRISDRGVVPENRIEVGYLPVVHEDEIVALMDSLSIEPTRSRADNCLSLPS